MLDRQSRKMLDFLFEKCGEDGAYKILEISDLKGKLGSKASAETVCQVMKFLKGLEHIDIKYSDESVYCVAVLPKGRLYEETHTKIKSGQALTKGTIALIIVGSFCAALAGTLLGSVLWGLIG